MRDDSGSGTEKLERRIAPFLFAPALLIYDISQQQTMATTTATSLPPGTMTMNRSNSSSIAAARGATHRPLRAASGTTNAASSTNGNAGNTNNNGTAHSRRLRLRTSLTNIGNNQEASGGGATRQHHLIPTHFWRSNNNATSPPPSAWTNVAHLNGKTPTAVPQLMLLLRAVRRNHPYLTRICLDYTAMTTTTGITSVPTAYLVALVQALRHNTTVTQLKLVGTALNDDLLAELANTLVCQAQNAVKRIKSTAAEPARRSRRAVTEADSGESHDSTASLDLGPPPTTPAVVAPPTTAPTPTGSSMLMDLDLPRSQFTDAGIVKFCRIVQRYYRTKATKKQPCQPLAIRRLNFETNAIEDEGMKELCALLTTTTASGTLIMPALTTLKLGRNSFGPCGIRAVATVLQPGPRFHPYYHYLLPHDNTEIATSVPPISVLDLRGNHFGDIGVQVLCEALHHNTTLIDLGLAQNDLSDLALCYLAEVLEKNYLQSLDLQRNHSLTGAGLQIMLDTLQHKNHSVTKLKIKNCSGLLFDRPLGGSNATSHSDWGSRYRTTGMDQLKQDLLHALLVNSHGPELARQTKSAEWALQRLVDSVTPKEKAVRTAEKPTAAPAPQPVVHLDHDDDEEEDVTETCTSASTGTTKSFQHPLLGTCQWIDHHRHDELVDQDVADIFGPQPVVAPPPAVAAESKDDIGDCAICYEAASDCVLLPCAHGNCCVPCAKQLTHCHMCRTIVVKVVLLADPAVRRAAVASQQLFG
jgi:Zinc finger, C3HC4 type (RING finger)/Leucine Rich repeat